MNATGPPKNDTKQNPFPSLTNAGEEDPDVSSLNIFFLVNVGDEEAVWQLLHPLQVHRGALVFDEDWPVQEHNPLICVHFPAKRFGCEPGLVCELHPEPK